MNRESHDTLFKETFGKTSQAASLLKQMVSPALVEVLDWSTLRSDNPEYASSKHGKRRGDLLFVVHTAQTGEPVWVNLILEHQRTADAKMPWRLLRQQYLLARIAHHFTCCVR